MWPIELLEVQDCTNQPDMGIQLHISGLLPEIAASLLRMTDGGDEWRVSAAAAAVDFDAVIFDVAAVVAEHK